MLCSCGRPHPTLFAERVDADKKAIDDLTKQLASQSGPLYELTKAKISELTAEVSAETKMRRALARSRREMISNLKAALDLTSSDQLLLLSRDELAEFILRGGLGLAIEDFIDAQEAITKSALDTLQVIISGASIADVPDLESLGLAAADSVFQDTILPNALAGVRTALQGISVGVPVNRAMTALSQRLEQAEGREITVVRTELAKYGRSITAKVAEEYDLDLYLYTGPRDGITRDFCKPLIGKVAHKQQINRLNNGQGLPVLTSGGGYNCRHSWSPVTEGFVEAAGLPYATSKDITKANTGGA
jgi:hypothetical protein